MQAQKTNPTKQEAESSPALAKAKAAAQRAAQASDLKNTTRVVTLISQSCCGCGCSDIKVRRKVPFDSPLKDGDYLHPNDILHTDKVL